MFYLKEGALIQRHHSSTKKKCCLISVTPLLLRSGSDEESEGMCHSHGTDISSPEILVCLKKYRTLFCIHLCSNGLSRNPPNARNVAFRVLATSQFPAGNVTELLVESRSASERKAPRCAADDEQEDGIWMRRRGGEETRTDIIWRTGWPACFHPT